MNVHRHTIRVSWEFSSEEEFREGNPSYTTMDIHGCPDSSTCRVFNHEDWDSLWDDGSVDDFLADALREHEQEHGADCELPDRNLRCGITVSDKDPVVKNSEIGYLFL